MFDTDSNYFTGRKEIEAFQKVSNLESMDWCVIKTKVFNEKMKLQKQIDDMTR